MHKRHCGGGGGNEGKGFVPPRRVMRRILTERERIFAHSCTVWGHRDLQTATRIFVAVQEESEFDFTKFLFGLGMDPGFKFIILDRFYWNTSGHVGMEHFLKSFPMKICVMGAGELCWPLALAVNNVCLAKLGGASSISSVAFFNPSPPTKEWVGRKALDGFANLPVLMEGGKQNEFEAMLKRAVVSRNYHEWFQRAMPVTDVLTQYTPPSPLATSQIGKENAPARASSVVLALVCEVCNVHFKRPSLRCYRLDREEYFVIPVSDQAAAGEGDVIKIDPVRLTLLGVLQHDDAVRIDFLRLLNGIALPNTLLLPSICKLNDLDRVQSEGRTDFAHVLVMDVCKLQLSVTDESLPPGHFATIRLQPGLHKASDFFPGLRVQLLRVKIEWRNERFNAVLDNQSGVVVLPSNEVDKNDTSLQVRFTHLDALVPLMNSGDGAARNRRCAAGEYRVRATVKDVFFSGISWSNELSGKANLFELAPHLRAAFTQANSCLLLLTDMADQIFCHCGGPITMREILPFVHPPNNNNNEEECLEKEFANLVLAKQVLDALVYEHNADFDFALKVVPGDEAGKAEIRLLHMDI